MKTLKIILGAIIVAIFITLGIQNVIETQNGVKLKEMNFETVDSKLNDKTIQLDKLNQQLESAKKNGTTSAEELKELQKQKEDWEKQKQEYESKLQSKAEEKIKLAAASKAAIDAATATQTVSAASAPSGTCESWLNEAGITNVNARELIKRESGCNPCAYNPGKSDCNYQGNSACGIPQALPCQKLRAVCTMTDAVCQLRWMVTYVMGRYGSWEAAIVHHNQLGWY